MMPDNRRQEDYRERLYRESINIMRLAKDLKRQRAVSPDVFTVIDPPIVRHTSIFRWMLSQNDRDFLRIQGIRPE